jgi:class 3 adenylate cyclase
MLLCAMPQLPQGTVTFLFSDIEGSTALLKRLGDEDYSGLLARHRVLVRETFAAHDGHEIDTQGDAFFYSFPRARTAVAAAVAVQRAHQREAWPAGESVRIRVGLHTGEPTVGEDGYTGLDVVRASRIAGVTRGGQVLVSEATRAIVADDLPDGVALRSIGEHRLKDIERPEPLHELTIEDVDVSTATPEPLTNVDGDALMREIALPGIAEALEQMPAWVRGAARFLPVGRASSVIEERVLTELDRVLREPKGRERAAAEREPAAQRPVAELEPSAAPDASIRSGSVSDEIAKLRDLRDAKALTEEQYVRAVERVLSASD